MPTNRQLPTHIVPIGYLSTCPPGALCLTPRPIPAQPSAPTAATGISQVFFPTTPLAVPQSVAPSDPTLLLPYPSFSANDWLALVQSGAFGYAS
jgi:hypothetical protein